MIVNTIILSIQLRNWTWKRIIMILKGNAAYFEKKLIMDENNALSEYNKIPLGHNRTNGAVYSEIYFKVEICSAH